MKESIGARIATLAAPVWVVGTYDETGRPNVATVAWGGVCCSKPACLNISLRKATRTHACITARKAFTVNIPGAQQLAAVDLFGLCSGRDHDKLALAGFHAVRSDLVEAPCIEEFPLVFECRLTHTLELGLHTLFVGEIADVKADPACLGPDRLPRAELVGPISYSPEAQAYHGLGPLLGQAFVAGRPLLPGK